MQCSSRAGCNGCREKSIIAGTVYRDVGARAIAGQNWEGGHERSDTDWELAVQVSGVSIARPNVATCSTIV
jgi:hypothetical protein